MTRGTRRNNSQSHQIVTWCRYEGACRHRNMNHYLEYKHPMIYGKYRCMYGSRCNDTSNRHTNKYYHQCIRCGNTEMFLHANSGNEPLQYECNCTR